MPAQAPRTGEDPAASPSELVRAHEDSIDPARRRELAAHYTPARLAERLVGLALGESDPGVVPSVCDPSCGAGAVLLAAADRLLELGAEPRAVLESHLIGFDLDAESVRAARSALQLWAVGHGVHGSVAVRVVQADALRAPVREGCFEVVVGNPPFASPLGSGTSRPAAGSHPGGAYVDRAAVHLLAAVRVTRPGGVTCLLQPQSVLGARDSAPVRAEVDALASLEQLWASDEDLFERARVRVCAPVLRRRVESLSARGPARPARRSTVGVSWRDAAPVGMRDRGPGSWASLLAAAVGTPTPGTAAGSQQLDVVANCTAGFRDEFYALGAAAAEAPPQSGLRGAGSPHRLVTSGMIDPGRIAWGAGSFRIAGRSFERPSVEPGDLVDPAPRVARWAQARRVPKVLVATQTRVLEAAVDRDGSFVPLTPVIAVEPRGGWQPEAIAAMISAPSNSALCWHRAAGTGRNPRALRVSAAAVAALRVASEEVRRERAVSIWSQLEDLADRGGTPKAWIELGIALDEAVGFAADPAVARWWAGRLPRRLLAAAT